MKLSELLYKHKRTIIDRWFQAIIETYPEKTSHFLKSNKDRFTNPVGHAFAEGLPVLFDGLLDDSKSEAVTDAITGIIKIRAVQDFHPSQAVVFVFLLKRAVTETVSDDIKAHNLFEELTTFWYDIDRLALFTFDCYMECREKINDIRVSQAKQGHFKPYERLQVLNNKSSQEGDSTNGER